MAVIKGYKTTESAPTRMIRIRKEFQILSHLFLLMSVDGYNPVEKPSETST